MSPPVRTASTRRGARFTLLALALCLPILGNVARADSEPPTNSKGLAEHTSEYVQDYLSDRRRVGALAGSILGGALTAHPAGTVVGSIIGFIIGKQTMFEDHGAKREAQSLAASRRDIVPREGQGQNAQTLSFADPQGLSFDASPPAVVSAAQAPVLQPHPAGPGASPAAVPAPTTSAATPAAAPAWSAPASVAASPAPGLGMTPSGAANRALPQPKIESPAVVSVQAAPGHALSRYGSVPAIPSPGFSRQLIAQLCSAGSNLPPDPRLRSLCFYNQSN